MREVITTIHTYCDVCSKEHGRKRDADESASIRGITFNGRAKRLDLCAEHGNPTWQTIIDNWVDDLEPSTKAANGARTGLECCICGKQTSAKTAMGLMVHMSKLHPEVDLAERQRLTGLPVTERNVNSHIRRGGGGELYSCPTCGKEFDATHRLTMHRVRAHDYRSGDDTA